MQIVAEKPAGESKSEVEGNTISREASQEREETHRLNPSTY